MRPDWDTYFLNIARESATRATCPQRQVGCVIAKHNRIVSTGYNGSPSGMAHCSQVGCQEVNGKCGRARHAEENAVRHGKRKKVQGATVYLTAQPCYRCALLLIDYKVRRVVYRDNAHPHKDDQAVRLLTEAGIVLERFE